MLILFSLPSFCQTDDETWPVGFLSEKWLKKGTGGSTETKPCCSCYQAFKCLKLLATHFSFVMERVSLQQMAGLDLDLIVSVCFAAAEPLSTAASFSSTPNNGAKTAYKSQD